MLVFFFVDLKNCEGLCRHQPTVISVVRGGIGAHFDCAQLGHLQTTTLSLRAKHPLHDGERLFIPGSRTPLDDFACVSRLLPQLVAPAIVEIGSRPQHPLRGQVVSGAPVDFALVTMLEDFEHSSLFAACGLTKVRVMDELEQNWVLWSPQLLPQDFGLAPAAPLAAAAFQQVERHYHARPVPTIAGLLLVICRVAKRNLTVWRFPAIPAPFLEVERTAVIDPNWPPMHVLFDSLSKYDRLIVIGPNAFHAVVQ